MVSGRRLSKIFRPIVETVFHRCREPELDPARRINCCWNVSKAAAREGYSSCFSFRLFPSAPMRQPRVSRRRILFIVAAESKMKQKSFPS